jgi:hypothetical protein
MVPTELQLQVVSGFVEGIGGTLSGQVDCMLVQGEGTAIPHTSSYKWPVRDVLAVFEVKKTLFSTELNDAHEQLRTVLDQFREYAESLTDAVRFDITASAYVYGQLVGEPAPKLEDVDSLPFQKQIVFRTLVGEQLAPLRIIFGYQGYASEYTLRAGFVRFLRDHDNMIGYDPGAMPNLIVCGDNSLVKLNGHPYFNPLQNGNWVWFGSSTENPLLLLLNLIFTKLMYVTSIPDWFARDLSLERFAPLLIGKGIKTGSNTGVWSYEPVLFTQQQLHRAAEVVDLRDWEPLKASPFQCTLVALIGDGLTRKKVNQIAAKFPESDAAREVDALIKHGIVGWYDDTLVFLTIQCVTLFTSKGQAVVGDADDPRFFEWYGREQRRGVKA